MEIILLGGAIVIFYALLHMRKNHTDTVSNSKKSIIILSPDIGEWIELRSDHYEYLKNLDDFLITNGEEIEVAHRLVFDVNSRPLYNVYSRKPSFITHWRPMPQPPKKK